MSNLHKNTAEQRIVLDQQALKTLAADTRIAVLKLLLKRKYTQSELASMLELSVPTVKEHLDALESQSFVVANAEGRKWKYYELTEKGVALLDPDGKKVWILLASAGILAISGVAGYFKQLFAQNAAEKAMLADMAQSVVEETAADASARTMVLSVSSAVEPAAAFPWGLLFYVLLIVSLLVIAIFYHVRSEKRKKTHLG